MLQWEKSRSDRRPYRINFARVSRAEYSNKTLISRISTAGTHAHDAHYNISPPGKQSSAVVIHISKQTEGPCNI